jgi:hypothetical protein
MIDVKIDIPFVHVSISKHKKVLQYVTKAWEHALTWCSWRAGRVDGQWKDVVDSRPLCPSYQTQNKDHPPNP